MTLAEAQARLRAAADRLMQGDERAQADFDHWDKVINNHPEHLQQVGRVVVLFKYEGSRGGWGRRRERRLVCLIFPRYEQGRAGSRSIAI
jgi:hypothetical protein